MPSNVRAQVFRNGQPEEVAPKAIAALIADPDIFVWCDVVDPVPADLAPLQQALSLHPLSVEDALHAHQRPKIETYGQGEAAYWFLVVHPATLTTDDLVLHEVAVFVGQRFVLTVRSGAAYPVAEIERRWLLRADGDRDCGFLLYTLLDAVVDGYFPVAEAFEERIDAIEAQLFDTRAGRNDLLLAIFRMKKDSQRFRRAAWPMRDILAPIVRGDLPLFSDGQRTYFRDVYDHAVRIVDQVDATRDMANSALDVQLAVTANRQNEVAKQLTVIATIFLPLSFITGFFGQNFGVILNHIKGAASFWIFGVATELAVVVALILVFRWRRWF